MRLQIDPEWLIDADELSVNLVHLRTITGDNARGRAPKAENIGKQREEVVGFYGSIEQALRAYMAKRAQGSDATTAEGLIKLLQEGEARVLAAVKQWGMTRKAVASAGAPG